MNIFTAATHITPLNLSIQTTEDGICLYHSLQPACVGACSPRVDGQLQAHSTLLEFISWEQVVILRDALNQVLAELAK